MNHVNMGKTKFSVIMSVYKNDNENHFERALNSITFEQTIKPDEIVLIVDGPVPDSINQIIDKFLLTEYNFKIIRLEKNQGLGNALKLAVENCENAIIARMDSDDVSVPNRFEQQLKIFEKYPGINIVGGDISEFIDDETNIVAYRKVPTSDTEIKMYLKKRCPFNHVSVMYKKEAVMKAGNYKNIFLNEDYFLWIKMYECSCKMMNTGTVLVNVRIGKDMYQRRGGKKYFESEFYLQRYMLKHKIINVFTFCSNVLKRWIVEIVMPNIVREFTFRTFAREKRK